MSTPAVSAWRPWRERAERAVARDYERLKPDILRTLRRKLAVRGVHVDDADLDAFYNQAWHGVYTRLAAGEAIGNRGGLVVTIAERRALDEVRSLHADRRAPIDELDLQQVDPDLAAQLDDQIRLSQFIEGLRDRLTLREQQAAALCYVHDYTRPEAALTLGVSARRMEKLMDSVSRKLGGLLSDIERGEWCERRESLIKAYALGLLDLNGARYVLAVAHLEDCPACRHRVLRMRGLAALTPPLPAALAALASGASGGAGDRACHTRRARHARNAGLTTAAAGALAATALAAARFHDDPSPLAEHAAGATTVAGGLPGVAGGTSTGAGGPPAVVGGTSTGAGGASTAAGGPPAVVGGVPIGVGGSPTGAGAMPTDAGGASTAAGGLPAATGGAPTSTGGGAGRGRGGSRTPASGPAAADQGAPRATRTPKPKATPKPPRAKRQPRRTSPAPATPAAPRATATPQPPAAPPAAPAPVPPKRDRDGAGEFELR